QLGRSQVFQPVKTAATVRLCRANVLPFRGAAGSLDSASLRSGRLWRQSHLLPVLSRLHRRENFIKGFIAAALALIRTIPPSTMSCRKMLISTRERSAQKPPGFTFLITGSNRASFRPRLVPGFGILEKSLTCD